MIECLKKVTERDAYNFTIRKGITPKFAENISTFTKFSNPKYFVNLNKLLKLCNF